jgi:hypothetical protein
MSLSGSDTSVCNNADGTPGTPIARIAGESYNDFIHRTNQLAPTEPEPLEVAVANDQWEQGKEQIRLIRSIRCYVAWAFWLGIAAAAFTLVIVAVIRNW